MQSRFLVSVTIDRALRSSFYEMEWKLLHKRLCFRLCFAGLLLLALFTGYWHWFCIPIAISGILFGWCLSYVWYWFRAKRRIAMPDMTWGFAFGEDSVIRSRQGRDSSGTVFYFKECCYYDDVTFLATYDGVLYLYGRSWEYPWICVPMKEHPDVCALLYHAVSKRVPQYDVKK